MRIGIFGNCQAEGLASSLRAWAPGVETIIQPVGTLPLNQADQIDEVQRRLLACDYILLQTVDLRRPQFRPFISDIIQRAPGRVERFPVVVFNGFHPDCVYVMRDGAAVDGPVGAYHSALAAAAWFEDLPQDRAVRLFNSYAYARLGYFDAYPRGLTYLKSEAFAGYDLAACVSPTNAFMHTINHPAVQLSVEIARQALDRLDVPRLASIVDPIDPLAKSGAWPVYPELAERLGLENTMSKHDFASLVARNFWLLQDASGAGPKDVLTSGGPIAVSAIERARSFIRSEVI